MGGIGAMLDKMPGMGGMAQAAQAQLDTKQFDRMEAMINSMTPKERKNPDLINPSRKRRITAGSGTAVLDLNRLLKQHKQMQKMMKKMKGGMQRMSVAWAACGRRWRYASRRWHATGLPASVIILVGGTLNTGDFL